jgi:FKBP-type peptidyl-prolyl cis-trans isomerase SlyD
MSTVADRKVVSFHYTLTDDDGEVIDSSEGDLPLEYLHGADNIVPGLERALLGKKVGDKLDVQVEPKDGYGERDDRAVHHVRRGQLPADMPVQVGMQLGAQDPRGGDPIPAWITEVKGDEVTLDFNHPLAGVRLHFAVEITAIREASAEELDHGHPHGPDGHGHP